MSHPLLIVSQSDYLIQTVDINSHTEWQTVQIQISWFLPTDLDLQCLLRLGMSCSAREEINKVTLAYNILLLYHRDFS